MATADTDNATATLSSANVPDILSFTKISEFLYAFQINLTLFNLKTIHLEVMSGSAGDAYEILNEASGTKLLEVNRQPLIATITTTASHMFRGSLVDATNDTVTDTIITFSKSHGDSNVTAFSQSSITWDPIEDSYLDPFFNGNYLNDGVVVGITSTFFSLDAQVAIKCAGTEFERSPKNATMETHSGRMDARETARLKSGGIARKMSL